MENEAINSQQPIITPDPVTPPMITPPPQPSHLVPIILSVLITTILLVGGYFLYTKDSSKKLTTNQSPAPISTATPTIDPTVNWQEYSNKKMNLSLKYPSDKNLKIFASQYNDLDFAINTAQFDPIYFEVAYLPTSQLQDWYQKAYSSNQQEQEKPPELQKGPEVDGHVSYQADFNLEVAGKIRNIFIQADKGIYQVHMPLSSNVTQYQILSTFKFTDSKVDAPKLTHYVLKDKKSSIEYPTGWTITDNSKQLNLDGDMQWSQDITVSKDGYTLTSRNPINWGPGICIFPESPDYNKDEVYGSKYSTYTKISNEKGELRRVKMVNPENSKIQNWGICSEVEPNVYSSVVGFGTGGYVTPIQYDESMLTTMDQILMSIKKEL